MAAPRLQTGTAESLTALNLALRDTDAVLEKLGQSRRLKGQLPEDRAPWPNV